MENLAKEDCLSHIWNIFYACCTFVTTLSLRQTDNASLKKFKTDTEKEPAFMEDLLCAQALKWPFPTNYLQWLRWIIYEVKWDVPNQTQHSTRYAPTDNYTVMHIKITKTYGLQQTIFLTTHYVTLISSRGQSVYELKAAMCAAANRIMVSEQFRCNNDMKTANAECHVISMVWAKMFFLFFVWRWGKKNKNENLSWVRETPCWASRANIGNHDFWGASCQTKVSVWEPVLQRAKREHSLCINQQQKKKPIKQKKYSDGRWYFTKTQIKRRKHSASQAKEPSVDKWPQPLKELIQYPHHCQHIEVQPTDAKT